MPASSLMLSIKGNLTRLSESVDLGLGGFFLRLDFVVVRAVTSRSVLRPWSSKVSFLAKLVAV